MEGETVRGILKKCYSQVLILTHQIGAWCSVICPDAAMDLAIYLIQTCVIQDNVVSAIELSNVVDALAKVIVTENKGF